MFWYIKYSNVGLWESCILQCVLDYEILKTKDYNDSSRIPFEICIYQTFFLDGQLQFSLLWLYINYTLHYILLVGAWMSLHGQNFKFSENNIILVKWWSLAIYSVFFIIYKCYRSKCRRVVFFILFIVLTDTK